jgi:hypothetical protein
VTVCRATCPFLIYCTSCNCDYSNYIIKQHRTLIRTLTCVSYKIGMDVHAISIYSLLQTSAFERYVI